MCTSGNTIPNMSILFMTLRNVVDIELFTVHKLPGTSKTKSCHSSLTPQLSHPRHPSFNPSVRRLFLPGRPLDSSTVRSWWNARLQLCIYIRTYIMLQVITFFESRAPRRPTMLSGRSQRASARRSLPLTRSCFLPSFLAVCSSSLGPCYARAERANSRLN